MRKLALLVSVCLSLFFSTNVIAMSDGDKQLYLDWVKENLDRYDNTSYIALGMAPNGCWGMGYHNNQSGAKRSAIKNCKKNCGTSSCEVVDRNGRSDFIKTKGMPFPDGFGSASGSSSSSSSSSSSNGFEKGEAYRNGEGVAKDYKEAVKWYTQVADKDSAAAFWIGMIYDEGGYGVTKDDGEATQWFMKGADMGDRDCQFMLGLNYEYGIGVSEDLEKAISWYQKAAAQGDPNSKQELKRLGVDISNQVSTSSSSSAQTSSSSSDVAYCLSKKYRRFVYIKMSGGCSASGRNISLEEYDLYNGCLVNLGLTPKAASLSKKEKSDLNECLIDVGSSYAETSSNTSEGSDR